MQRPSGDKAPPPSHARRAARHPTARSKAGCASRRRPCVLIIAGIKSVDKEWQLACCAIEAREHIVGSLRDMCAHSSSRQPPLSDEVARGRRKDRRAVGSVGRPDFERNVARNCQALEEDDERLGHADSRKGQAGAHDLCTHLELELPELGYIPQGDHNLLDVVRFIDDRVPVGLQDSALTVLL